MQHHGGGQGGGGIHQAVSLEAGGVEIAGALIGDGLGGAHQQQIDKILKVGAAEVGIALGDLLAQEGGASGQEGGGHGGAAHVAVAAQGIGQGGVDVAAGGGDLGLQLQLRGDAHGGELGHLTGGGVVHGTVAVENGDGLLLQGHQVVAVGFGDEDGGDGSTLHSHIAELALHIVADDDGDGTGLLAVEDFLAEGQLSTAHQGDLATEVACGGVIGCGAHAADCHEFIGAGDGVDVHIGVGVGDETAAGLDGGEGGHQIVGTGHGQGHAEAGGGADHAGVRVGGQGHVHAGVVPQSGVILVAGGADQADTGLPDTGIGFGDDPVTAVGKAAVGAQGHIDDVRTQHDRILQSGQGHGVGGAGAGIGEGFEDEQLGIGSHAGEEDLALGVFSVTGGDARHMGAVADIVGVRSGIGVHIGIEIRIVKGEGDFGADEGVGGGEAGEDGFAGQIPALHGGGDVARVECGTGGVMDECLVVGVQAGVDDGDGDALAGVAAVPAGEDIAQVCGGIHGGLHQIVDGGGEGVLHAGELPKGFQVAVGDAQGEAVEDGGVLPAELGLAVGQASDVAEDAGLIVQQTVTGLVGLGAVEIRLGKGLEQGSGMKLHDHIHKLVGIGFLGGQVAAVKGATAFGQLQGIGDRFRCPGCGPDGSGQEPQGQRQCDHQTAKTQNGAGGVFHFSSSLLFVAVSGHFLSILAYLAGECKGALEKVREY